MFSLCIPTIDRYDDFLSSYLPKYIENPYVDEIIITDENGNDIKKIVSNLSSSKLKLYTNGSVLGPFLNKLEACKKASREWIVLMDSDNFADIDYFKGMQKYIQSHALSKFCVLSPSWAYPEFDFSHLSNTIITRKNLKQMNARRKKYPTSTLMNTGNYVVHSHLMKNLDLSRETNIQLSHACDVIYMNTLFFEQFEQFEFHVLDIKYTHVVHNGCYATYATSFKDFNAYVHKRYKKL